MKQTSIAQQWIISVLLSTLPLILAVLFALWTINNQAGSQRDLLRNTLQLQNAITQFKEELNNAERSIRQFLLLKDNRFEEIYMQRYKTVNALIEQLLSNPLLKEWIETNSNEKRGFEIIIERLDFDRISQQDSDTISHDFSLMNQFAEQSDLNVKKVISNALKINEKTFNDAIRTSTLLGLIVLPITLLLFLLSTQRISIPFRKLTQSINKMGKGSWKHPVSIEGPSDIVFLGENLEWMRTQLIELDQQKQEFIGHITHELKTPLASIIEAASLLSDEIPGSINSKQHNVLTILEQNAESLKLRIEQLLDYNQIIQSSEHHRRKVDLREFVSRIIEKKILIQNEKQKNDPCPY